jgi:protocatechuate 3,4-dioxygenase beta subunit
MKLLLALVSMFVLAAADAPPVPVLGGPCEDCEIAQRGMPAEPGPVARIAPIGEPGEPMVLEGVVRSADGKPAAGIVVYGYHTNAKGRYPGRDARHGDLRGWARTGADGRYRFETIRPGAYPGRRDPQHIHLHVIEPGRGTYYIDDVLFADDPRLTPERRARLAGRGGSGVTTPERDADGTWRVRRDIVLGRNIPGYP